MTHGNKAVYAQLMDENTMQHIGTKMAESFRTGINDILPSDKFHSFR